MAVKDRDLSDIEPEVSHVYYESHTSIEDGAAKELASFGVKPRTNMY